MAGELREAGIAVMRVSTGKGFGFED